MNSYHRLTDPDGLVNDNTLAKLNDKLSKAMIRLAGKSENGGNPFLFAFIGSKPHELQNHLQDLKTKFTTCATDGKKFYWYPKFLERLDVVQLITCLQHEAWHVALDHLNRFEGKNRLVWNIAIDYIVNAIIEDDWNNAKDSKRKNWISYGANPWNGLLGNPLNLKNLLYKLEHSMPVNNVVFADITQLHSTALDIYNKILEKWKDTNKISSMDDHLQSELGKEELDEEIINAVEQAEAIEPGSVPGVITDYIKELSHPKLDLADLISATIQKTKIDGIKNNWKRPKRRGIAVDYFLPKRYTYKPSWLCLVDTSGSMSLPAIEHGLSQLQSIGEDTNGFIVTCDTQVHWDSITEINEMADLKQTKIVGRGGTALESFFSEWRIKLDCDFDIIIVITDGYLINVDKYLRPDCEVIWIIVGKKILIPSFGNVINI